MARLRAYRDAVLPGQFSGIGKLNCCALPSPELKVPTSITIDAARINLSHRHREILLGREIPWSQR